MRWLWAGLLIVLLTVAGAWLFRAELAVMIMTRAVETAMARDRVAELPDGLHLFVCGAGSPLPDRHRSGPCLAVIAGDRLFVVDAGTGGARNLQAAGVLPGRIAAVFVTHDHSDHIDGLGELAMLRWTGGGHAQPLPVYGPPGITAVVHGFNLAYSSDFGHRVAHHGAEVVPPAGAGMRAAPFPAPEPGAAVEVWRDEQLVVTAFRVAHDPIDPAVGYRFDYAGRSLVISGDTTPVDETVRMASGVDLLAHEALAADLVGIMEAAARAAGQDRLAHILADIPDYHTTPVEAAELAARAEVLMLLLYHIVPPLPLPGLEAAFLRGVRSVYSGEVLVARDGVLISLPADGSGAARRRLRI